MLIVQFALHFFEVAPWFHYDVS